MNAFYWVVVFSIVSFTAAMYSKRLQKGAPAEEKLCEEQKETYLQDMGEGEEMKAFSVLDPKHNYFCAVTNERIVFDTKDGLVSLPYGEIEKVKYETMDGHKANAADSVFQIIIKVRAGKKYKLYRQSAHFTEIPAAMRKYC